MIRMDFRLQTTYIVIRTAMRSEWILSAWIFNVVVIMEFQGTPNLENIVG